MHTEGFQDALGAGYRLLDRRGSGASGEVWRALDRRTDEVVAAKLLRREHVEDRDLVGRFLRERSILTRLRHPGIVAVRDLVAEGDRLAIVMDFVDGGSLREVLQTEGPLPPDLAVAVAAAVLEAVASAHDLGVLHRDLKPDNVLLAEGWRDLQPGGIRLTDFGIARILADGAGTTTGLLGTPEYLPPELITIGEGDLPGDVYGAGVLLYELLAGRTPFAGPGTDYSVAHRHVSSEPPRLPVPDDLWGLLDTLLAKDPAERPSAARAAAALRALGPGLAGLPALPTQTPPGEFATSRGPATMIKGLPPQATSPDDQDAEPGAPDDAASSTTAPADLGAPGPATLLRPMPRTSRPARTPDPQHRDTTPGPRPWWRDRRVIAVVAGAALLVAGAVVLVTGLGGDEGSDPTAGTPGAAAATATQQDPPLPTGLTIRRSATYDPEQQTVELTVTYAAQNAPLGGPFLEVLPGTGDDCPTPQWLTGDMEANLPSATGVTTPCGWSVDPGTVPRQGSVEVTARVPVSLDAADGGEALQEWLDAAAAGTTAAVTDPDLTGTAYPVQRLQGVDVVAPARTVSQRTLRLVLHPVWPSGRDELNPLYRSPALGEPSSVLRAVAGGEDGVRFSDACSGSLAVSPDGLVVTALTVAPQCYVAARVGNFTDLASNTFAIVTRGG